MALDDGRCWTSAGKQLLNGDKVPRPDPFGIRASDLPAHMDRAGRLAEVSSPGSGLTAIRRNALRILTFVRWARRGA
jgi:hypothetical protein